VTCAQGEEFDPSYHDPHEYDMTYGNYDGSSCGNCGRERVMIGGATGRRVCEKCGAYQDTRPSNVLKGT